MNTCTSLSKKHICSVYLAQAPDIGFKPVGSLLEIVVLVPTSLVIHLLSNGIKVIQIGSQQAVVLSQVGLLLRRYVSPAEAMQSGGSHIVDAKYPHMCGGLYLGCCAKLRVL